MGRRFIRMLQQGRGALGALLFLLLAFALVPRTAVVVHTHAGGEHAHVHLDDEHHGHHSHVHGHHHEFDHDHGDGHDRRHEHTRTDSSSREPEKRRQGAALQSAFRAGSLGVRRLGGAFAPPIEATSPANLTAAVSAGAPHWHAQHPYLLCLPAPCPTQTLLFSLDRHEPTAPWAHAGEPVALPFARGPPPISVPPTFQAV